MKRFTSLTFIKKEHEICINIVWGSFSRIEKKNSTKRVHEHCDNLNSFYLLFSGS